MAALGQLHPCLCFTGEQPLCPSSPFPNSGHYSVPLHPSLLTSFSIHMQCWGFRPTMFSLLLLFPLEIYTCEVSGSSLTFRSDLCSSLGNSSQSRTQLRRQDSGALEKRPQPLGEQSPVCAALTLDPDPRTSELSLCFSHHPCRVFPNLMAVTIIPPKLRCTTV